MAATPPPACFSSACLPAYLHQLEAKSPLFLPPPLAASAKAAKAGQREQRSQRRQGTSKPHARRRGKHRRDRDEANRLVHISRQKIAVMQQLLRRPQKITGGRGGASHFSSSPPIFTRKMNATKAPPPRPRAVRPTPPLPPHPLSLDRNRRGTQSRTLPAGSHLIKKKRACRRTSSYLTIIFFSHPHLRTKTKTTHPPNSS